MESSDTGEDGSRAGLESIQLADGSSRPPARTNDWHKFTPIPIAIAAYTMHRFYRRYCPRRLPPLTPLRLLELYAAGTATAVLMWDRMERYGDIGRDLDLLTIDLVGRNIGREHSGLRHIFDSLRRENKQAEVDLPALRKQGSYPEFGMLKKAAWWYDHVWSDTSTWCSAAACVMIHRNTEKQKGNAIPENLQGMRACITYIANCTDRTDYGGRIFKAFGCSIPFAMAARWSGRALLFRPLNLLQRLLLAGLFVADVLREHQRLWYITRFREYDAGECARFLNGMFGADQVDLKLAIDNDGRMPPFFKD